MPTSWHKLCYPLQILKTRHIHTEVPRPTTFLKEKMKTDDFSPSETLVKPAKPSNVSHKNGDQTKTRRNTHSGTPPAHAFHFQDWHFFCLYLSIFDCLRCPPLKVCHLFVSHTHPACLYVVCEPRASPSGLRAAGRPCAKTLGETIGK